MFLPDTGCRPAPMPCCPPLPWDLQGGAASTHSKNPHFDACIFQKTPTYTNHPHFFVSLRLSDSRFQKHG